MEVGSVHSLHELDRPLPTEPAENKAVTLKRLSYVFGFLYSIFLIILSLLLNIFSSSYTSVNWTSILTIYIVLSGLVILCILIVDVKLFTRRIRNQVKILRRQEDELELEHLRQFDANDQNGGIFVNYEDREPTPGLTHHEPDLEHIEHHYCFARGRHAGSVYIKFGAAAFALGHFVHGILLVVVVHVSVLMTNAECINTIQYVADVLQCVYCFVQLFFIFNYSNLIINKYTNLSRLLILHIMTGNICLWLSAVRTETKLAFKAYKWTKFRNSNSTDLDLDEHCKPNGLLVNIFDYSAYLYPFTVEFNILVVGIFFMVWRHIGKCRHAAEEVREFQHSLYAHTNVSGEVNSPHVMDIHISCHSGMGGLFSGLFVVVILVVAIILGFVFGNLDSEYLQNIGYVIFDSMKLLFHSTMLVVTTVAFNRTRRLDVNQHPVPWLDDVLLYVCIPAFFLETMFTIVAVVNILNVVKLIDTIVMSVQMMVQIAFVIDGVRRCSNARRLRRTKPGRELVLLLLVCNVCIWLLYTFSYKSPESKDERYSFYGKKVWLAVGHLCSPLIMFFRFHSSVCIADIWSYAYKPGVEDH